jgi:hypothetical protein
MRGKLAAVAVATIATTTVVSVAGMTPASAVTIRHFANCTAMHLVYRGGVARVGAHDKRASGHATYRPYINTRLYNANSRLDRDHDGVACEH